MRRSKLATTAIAMIGAITLWNADSVQARSARPDATAASTCYSEFNGTGEIAHICEYFIKDIEYDGRTHHFVVRASDNAVVHTWETSRTSETFVPWVSLGGVALSPVHLATFDSGRALKIQVYGTDNTYWCRQYNAPSARGRWTSWYRC